MNKVNAYDLTIAAMQHSTGIIDIRGNEINVVHHPVMGVLPVKAVHFLGNVLYIGYLADYNTTSTEVNTVINVYAEEFVATVNKNLLYGIDNKYITAIVANGDYNKIVDAVADNNLRVRVVRG